MLWDVDLSMTGKCVLFLANKTFILGEFPMANIGSIVVISPISRRKISQFINYRKKDAKNEKDTCILSPL